MTSILTHRIRFFHQPLAVLCRAAGGLHMLLLAASLAGFNAPAMAAAASADVAAAAIGEVVFIVGQAELQRGGQGRAVEKGQTLQQGDWIKTGINGHVHLRMQDKGFIAVRPGSSLQIRAYAFHPEAAAQNRVLLYLDKGVARTVSGQAGEANRQQYRFTTPIAAIGLRGTDYVVQSQDDLTRVSVLKGAVIVSPLGGGCTADLTSICGGKLAKELSAQSPNAYLEVRQRTTGADVILHENSRDAPNRQTPPRPEEPRANLDSDVTSTRLSESINDTAITPPASVPPATIVWGRWQHVATNTPTVASVATPDRQVTYANGLFALFVPSSEVTLPSGRIGMRYDAGEAWLQDASGALTAVPLSNGSLTLDFNQRQFQTSLNAQLPDATRQLQAQGSITHQGFLIGDPAKSTMNANGAITTQAQEAGYVFDSKQPGGTLSGVTHWRR